MVIRLRFEVKAGRAIRMMRDKAQRARDLRAPYRKAAEQVRRKMRGYFNRGGDGDWVNLRPTTVYLRKNKLLRYSAPSLEGPSKKILQWTHRLRNSLTQAHHREHISRFRGRMIYEYGTSVPYAHYHQDEGGTSITKGAIRGGGNAQRRPLPDRESEFVAQLFLSQVKMHFGLGAGA